MREILIKFKHIFLHNKSLKQTIVKNTFWLLVAQVIDTGAGFFVMIAIARYFGPHIFGQWTFAFGFSAIFALIADFGFSTILTRDLAKDQSKTAKYIDNIFFLKILLSVLSMLVIFMTLSALGKSKEVVSLSCLLGLYSIIGSFTVLFQAVFRSREKMEFETITRFIQSAARLLLVINFIYHNGSIIDVANSHILAAALGSTVSIILIWSYFSKFFKKIDLVMCKEILEQTWPVAVTSIVVMAYMKIGGIILSFLKTDKDVGFYGAAFGLVYNLPLLPSLFLTSVYPALSRIWAESKEKAIKVYKKSLQMISILAILIFPILYLFAGKIITIFFKNQYLPSVAVFRILLFAQLFSFLGCIFIHTLFAIGKQVVYAKIATFVLAINIALSLIFIPKYSFIGLGYVMIATELIGFLLGLYYTSKYLKL